MICIKPIRRRIFRSAYLFDHRLMQTTPRSCSSGWHCAAVWHARANSPASIGNDRQRSVGHLSCHSAKRGPSGIPVIPTISAPSRSKRFDLGGGFKARPLRYAIHGAIQDALRRREQRPPATCCRRSFIIGFGGSRYCTNLGILAVEKKTPADPSVSMTLVRDNQACRGTRSARIPPTESHRDDARSAGGFGQRPDVWRGVIDQMRRNGMSIARGAPEKTTSCFADGGRRSTHRKVRRRAYANNLLA